MAKTTGNDTWTEAQVRALAPDDVSIPAAREVLKKGGFGTVEPTTDGRGWWVVCRGITGEYQVSARRNAEAGFDCECTCPSYKYPCKHALALLLYLAEHPELRTKAETPQVAATDFEALVRAVFRNPEEDTPRLVFADFLEENDQPDRAALIRYQCEQARFKGQGTRYKELAKLIDPLVARFRNEMEPLPEGFECEFRRGFLRLRGNLSSVSDVGSLPVRFTNLFRDGWVESVDGGYYFGAYGDEQEGFDSLVALVGELDLSRYPLSDETLACLVADTAASRAHGRLVRVKVHKTSRATLDQLLAVERGETVDPGRQTNRNRHHSSITPTLLDLLARAGRLNGCRVLSLGGLTGALLGDADVPVLLAADHGPLESLRLDYWHLSRAGVAQIVAGTALPQLRHLMFEVCEFDSGAIEAIADATGLRGLETLRFSDCDLTDDDAAELARATGYPNLVRIDLPTNPRVTRRGAVALLASRNFPKLSDLDLDDCGIAPPQQVPLVLDALDRPTLTVAFADLIVRRRMWEKEVAVEIVARGYTYDNLFSQFDSCRGAKRVTRFSAPRLQLGADAVTALTAGFDPETLWSLDLTDNPLRNAGAAALARAFGNFQLKELKLSRCRIQSTGVQALVKSPMMGTLRTLNLSGNNIGKAGVAALLKVAMPPALKELILTDCRLTADDKKKLKEKYGAKVKV